MSVRRTAALPFCLCLAGIVIPGTLPAEETLLAPLPRAFTKPIPENVADLVDIQQHVKKVVAKVEVKKVEAPVEKKVATKVEEKKVQAPIEVKITVQAPVDVKITIERVDVKAEKKK